MALEAIQGALRPSLGLTWADDDGAAFDLTGATLSGAIEDQNTGTARAIEGDLVLVDADAGVFRWDYAAADVEDAGRFYVQFTATFGMGQTPAKTQRALWRVHEAIVVEEE